MIDTVFLVCAVLGGAVFLLRTILQLIGVGAGDAMDAGDVADIEEVHTDTDSGFRILSLHGISAFLMMFGLVGLALTRQSGVGGGVSIGVAAIAASARAWVIARVFSSMSKLQSTGNLQMSKAVGQEGVVYLTIGAGGIGKVQVEVHGRLGVFDAQVRGGKEIATGKRVRVLEVTTADMLIVELIA